MRFRSFLSVCAILFVIPAFAKGPVDRTYGLIPLSFEQNDGQLDPRIKFISRGPGYGLFLTADEAVLRLVGQDDGPATVRMRFDGGTGHAAIRGVGRTTGTVNYLTGSIPGRWQRGIPVFGGVRYNGIYKGIDVTYYGNQRRLEYDFEVAPGASPETIRLQFDGLKKLAIDGDGELVLTTSGGVIRQPKPTIYQEEQGRRVLIDGRYVLRGRRSVGFRVGQYDRTKPLIIDPVLIYSTYFGGTAADQANAIAVDAVGNAYITGQTVSTDLLTVNPAQPVNKALTEGFVLKLDPTGTDVVYATYFGGAGNDEGHSIAVDSGGNAYVTGSTSSADFPTTANAAQRTRPGGQDAFLLKLNPAGTLLYSTYLGGDSDDRGRGVALDSSGGIYVTGLTGSGNFPTTAGAFQRTRAAGVADVFVTKFSPAPAVQYSTFVGGRGDDEAYAVAVDSSGAAYVTGFTTSANLVNGNRLEEGFPLVAPFQADYGGSTEDAFIFKLSPSGSSLQYSTYLGGAGSDIATRIAVDRNGVACVTGITNTDDSVAVTPFPLIHPTQAAFGGGNDAFISCLAPDGQSLTLSSYFGGEGNDSGTGIAFDASGQLYVAGYTESVLLTNVNSIQSFFKGARDGFVLKLDPTSGTTSFATWLGGSGAESITGLAVDSTEDVYVAGVTASTDLSVTFPFQPQNNGGNDAFIAKINTRDIVSNEKFSISTQGGLSVKTTGDRTNAIFGYASAEAPAGSSLNGLAILESKPSGVKTVSQTGIVAPPLTTSGRLFVEVTSNVRSVISIANPNSEDATVDFFLTEADGTGSHFFTVTVPAYNHFSRFVTDDPVNIAADLSGSLTFTSSIPVAATAFRTMNNERADFLISSTPIVDPTKPLTDQPLIIPEFADGAGWTTGVVLVNTSEEQMSGEVQFFSPGNATEPGTGVAVATADSTAAVFGYDIPPRGFQRIQTTGAGARSAIPFTTANGFTFSSTGLAADQSAGYATASSANGTALNGLALVESRQNGVTVSQTGVLTPPLVRNGRVFVEVTAQIQTVLSIVNPTDEDGSVAVYFTDASGVSGSPVGLSVLAHGRLSQSLSADPLNIATDSVGTLTFDSTVPISVTVMRTLTNERSETLTSTIPVAGLNKLPNQPLVLPYFSDGAGWTSSVILVNNGDTEMRGEVRFVGPDSTPVDVGLSNGSVVASAFQYVVPPRSSDRIQTAGAGLRSSFPFSNVSGFSFKTTGVAASQTTSYATVNGTAASPVNGLQILERTENGLAVSQAAALSAPLYRIGRFFVEVSSNVKSRISIVNPTDNAATIDFFFTDASGNGNFFSTVTVAAHGQFSQFVSDAPLSIAAGSTGTLNFTASERVAVNAFRYYTNEAGETIISATPIADPTQVSSQSSIIPYFADGANWNSEVVLVNTTESRMQGEVRFFSQSGAPVAVAIGGALAPVVAYDIPPRSFQTLSTAGTATTFTGGWIQIAPYGGNNTPHAHAIIALRGSDKTLFQTPVEGVQPAANPRAYAEASGNFDAANDGATRTTIAIANPSGSAATLRLTLTAFDGTAVTSSPLSVPANGQIALSLNQVPGLQSLPASFKGVLQVVDSSTPVAVTALRLSINRAGRLMAVTTGPLKDNARQAGELIYPGVQDGVLDGNGFTTEVIAVNSALTARISGAVNFFSQDGSALAMDELRNGSIRVVPFSGFDTPHASVILSRHAGGITLFETAIEGRPAATNFTLYAEASADFRSHAAGATQTAIALANPSSSAVSVRLDLTQLDGVSLGTAPSLSIPPNGQRLLLLDEISGFPATGSFKGFVRVSSTSPVTAASLRALYNSRGDLLETTTGPLNENATATTNLVIPYFIDGAGNSTRIVLTGGSAGPIFTGSIQFFASDGTALNVDEPRSGSIHIVPYGGNHTPDAHVILAYMQSGNTLFQTAVQGQQPTAALRLYAESSGDFDNGAAGSKRTSVAIANPSAAPAAVRLELRNLTGSLLATSSLITIPANGQIGMFLNQIQGFQSLPASFQGVLRVIDVSGSGTTAASFRSLINEGGELLITTTGPLDEEANSSRVIFPHIAEGGGYTTTFVVINGSAVQTSSGVLFFIDEQGSPLAVTLTNP